MRWTGTIKNHLDTYPTTHVPEAYTHLDGQVLVERAADATYFPGVSNGDLFVSEQDYELVSGTIDYEERLRHVNDEGQTTCLQTVTLHITDPASYVDPAWPAMRLPNAGFGLPRKANGSLGSELEVNEPYSEDCGRGDVLDVFSLPLHGDISADGKQILVNETGLLGEGSGTFELVVNLQAVRE